MVSKNILDKSGRLKYCVRNEPSDDPDSMDNGWTFLSNIDTNDYLADLNNLVTCSFEEVAQIEPAIIGMSRMPIGTDIQICTETQKVGLFSKNYRMYIADTPSGKEVILKDEDIEFDSRAFSNWINYK